ncbi:MAG TPA: phosphotransferase family protein [Candidatus Binataceae bacterium]|nr:phosphotransferase family protein [Candidatus Binataceae bacterium]
MADIPASTETALNAMVRARIGDISARAHSLETLPGHAGFSYSFILDREGQPSRKLVVRIAPPAVKIAGPADIVRQARIMASLADSKVPVPPILWYGDEPEFFDRPYFVAEFVEGFKLSEEPLPPADLARLARAGIAMLTDLHAVAWERRREVFGDPLPLADEMKRLDNLMDRPTLDPVVVARGPEVRERLRASIPTNARIGCIHGDFQWSNILFNHERPIALIDWEISSIGPTLLDLGWVAFFCDPESWHPNTERVRPLLADEIVETYAASAPFPVSTADVRWFRAFAGYRFGVITCFNLMLHRRGKRDDPHWEEVALSAPQMFDRALELLG